MNTAWIDWKAAKKSKNHLWSKRNHFYLNYHRRWKNTKHKQFYSSLSLKPNRLSNIISSIRRKSMLHVFWNHRVMIWYELLKPSKTNGPSYHRETDWSIWRTLQLKNSQNIKVGNTSHFAQWQFMRLIH